MIDIHYVLRPPELHVETFAQLVTDVKDILFVAKKAIPVCGFNGTGTPETSFTRV